MAWLKGHAPAEKRQGIPMKTQRNTRRGRRVGPALVAAMMLMQTMLPAYATVSQLPAIYTKPPDANVMFTLDDSSSMWSDAVPDIPQTGYVGLTVPDDDGTFYNRNGTTLKRVHPNMWGSASKFRAATFFAKSNPVARYLRSSAGNPLYYDPTATYLPWPTAADDTKLSPAATPTSVNINRDTPFTAAFALDITTRVNESGGALPALDDESKNYWPATYFVYNGTVALPLGAPNALLNAALSDPNLFQKFEIKPSVTAYPRAATRSDCTGTVGPTGCTYAQELQNFANWLQYYRDRALMAKGGTATAFSKQGTNLRVGFGTINSTGTIRQGVSQFSGTARTNIYNDLYSRLINGGTPLRKALDDVGKYFQRNNVGNPWAQDPSSSSIGTEYTCRKSVHILSTDGFWKDAAATAPASGSNDAFSGSTPPAGAAGGKTYTFSDAAAAATETDPLVGRFTISPFSDANGNQLSDVAAYYWRNDLRPDLNNDVFASARDPAFWQHVSTYTVGLGVSGTGTVQRTSDGSTVVPYTEPSTSPFYSFRGQPWVASQQLRDLLIARRTPLTWPKVPGDEAPESGDDLIHTSMSGRGRYLSATNPIQLAAGMSALLAEATDNPSSLASVATSSNSLSSDNRIYQVTYNPNQWYGRLYAFSQTNAGTVTTTPSLAVWEASNMMPTPASRKIYTWDPDAKLGSTFTWTNGLTTTQKGYLGNDSTLLDYLRGSDTKELAQGGAFRDRSRYTVGSVKGGVLGDVVNGSPIKGPSAGGGFDRLPSGTPGQASYATYRSAGNTGLNSMRDTIFLGANDGMLHAFNRIDGVERFAYVPNAVFNVPRSLAGAAEAKLKMLSDPGYLHRFTVDGPPQIADAFIGPSAAASTWKTVLVGSTGAGARSVFAMDVTNPKDAGDTTAPAGAFDKTKILWEFSEANNADMGYVINYPQVARMRDGTWVAIFGNGYDSANGQAKLFILNLQTGAVLWQQSVGAAGGNGLSQPNFTVNTNREVTAIYAGDLKGNLWKFDVDNPTPSNWKVAFGGAPNYTPLYAGAATQPITVMPELTMHPNGGWLVSFGTGKLFESEDSATTVATNVNLNTQSIYGVWDKPGELTGFTGRTTLVAQTANTALAAATDANANVSGTTSNTVNWATKRGWVLDLGTGGERVHVNPLQAKNTLLVVANKPTDNSDPCSTGGSSRLFGLDPITGGAPDFGVFNSNGDGTINNADKGYNVKALTTVMLSLPVLQTKTTTADQITTEAVGSRGQTGARAGGVEPKVVKATDCTQWLLAGASNTSIPGFDVSLCKNGNPRVSWRQIK
jgi:type IV pilus assembly protein PilY1